MAIYSAQIDYSGSYELRGVYYDPDGMTGQEVTLVFFNYRYNRSPCCSPRTAATSARPSLTHSRAVPSSRAQDVDAGRVIYTRKGIVVADWTGSAILYDFGLDDTGKRLDLGQGGEVRIAFDLEGDTFLRLQSRGPGCCTGGKPDGEAQGRGRWFSPCSPCPCCAPPPRSRCRGRRRPGNPPHSPVLRAGPRRQLQPGGGAAPLRVPARAAGQRQRASWPCSSPRAASPPPRTSTAPRWPARWARTPGCG